IAASVEDTAAPTTATNADIDDELTLEKTLIAIKAAKPKVISTATTTPKAKEVKIKLEAKMRAEMEEGEKIARKKMRKIEIECGGKPKENSSRKLKRCLEIVPEDDDDDVEIEATPLSSKFPTISDYKIYREGKKSYFKIIRADGNSQNYLTFRTMFKNFNREDFEVLRSIVKEKFKKIKPVDDMEKSIIPNLKDHV
nr:hypothetical protein [Tanacetum cinerariifolium]